jgi:hypothetical protein
MALTKQETNGVPASSLSGDLETGSRSMPAPPTLLAQNTPGESSSGNNTSGSGQRRTTWDKFREAFDGITTIGPREAFNAAYGEDYTAATNFASSYQGWTNNAARHGVWMARLRFKHGERSATAIGDAHERGSPNQLDTFIDQHNNRIARTIGASVSSLEEIPGRVRSALGNGQFITDPSDQRVPENLRGRVHQSSSNSSGASSGSNSY